MIAVFVVSYLSTSIYPRLFYKYCLYILEGSKHPFRRTSLKRGAQLEFVNVIKRSSIYEISDVWFDIAKYIADPNDGVRSYHQKHQWLECLLLPNRGDSKRHDPSQVLPAEFQIVRNEFESTPGKFIEHVEAFSKLLTFRDLCDSIMEHLVKKPPPHDTESLESKLDFWVELDAKLLCLMDDGDSLVSYAQREDGDASSSKRALQILSEGLDSNRGSPYSSAKDNLQRFLERSDEDRKQRYKSQCCFPTEFPDLR